jgi:hypothetical protein
MVKRYLVLLLLTMTAFASGCASLGIGQATATPIPFERYSAQDVFDAFSTAGVEAQNLQRDMVVGRGAPAHFKDRYVFEVPRIAPAGGQIIVFDRPEDLTAWQAYVTQLRADAATRRDVVYVFVKDNILLQVNANLTTQEATAYENALMGLN